jgi:hypothetical protein
MTRKSKYLRRIAYVQTLLGPESTVAQLALDVDHEAHAEIRADTGQVLAGIDFPQSVVHLNAQSARSGQRVRGLTCACQRGGMCGVDAKSRRQRGGLPATQLCQIRTGNCGVQQAIDIGRRLAMSNQDQPQGDPPPRCGRKSQAPKQHCLGPSALLQWSASTDAPHRASQVGWPPVAQAQARVLEVPLPARCYKLRLSRLDAAHKRQPAAIVRPWPSAPQDLSRCVASSGV